MGEDGTVFRWRQVVKVCIFARNLVVKFCIDPGPGVYDTHGKLLPVLLHIIKKDVYDSRVSLMSTELGYQYDGNLRYFPRSGEFSRSGSGDAGGNLSRGVARRAMIQYFTGLRRRPYRGLMTSDPQASGLIT
jgi:hypothetical protein